ncbi:MAG TPA: hypothetical protein VIL46_06170 [Gemmataceae bacterium]
MRRKHLLLTLGIVTLVVVLAVAALVFLVRHEPAFYRALAVEPGATRKKASSEFQRRTFDLMNGITNHDPAWGATFTQEQINCYFQEDFVRSGGLEELREQGFHDPRVSIEPDRVRLAFRYGSGFWQTVVSVDVKLWLTAEEPNVVAMELRGLYAGSLPLPAQSLLDYITEAAHQMNIDVKWYRHNGHPVALMRFQADQVRPTVQLQRLQVQPGRIVLAGRSLVSPGPGAGAGALAASLDP